jgi:SAM-dependent methyltransferase
MADHETEGHLGTVYRAAGPAELAASYDEWADAYDADMAKAGYRHPAIVTALLARHCQRGSRPILDAGCGTGLVGEWLGILGWPDVHGLDISPGMIAAASAKRCYSGFTQAALGAKLPFGGGHFAAVISSGVFTTGHVGAEGVDELIRVTCTGGVIILTVKNALWASAMKGRIEAFTADGAIAIAEITEPYISMPNEPLATPTLAVVLRRS